MMSVKGERSTHDGGIGSVQHTCDVCVRSANYGGKKSAQYTNDDYGRNEHDRDK